MCRNNTLAHTHRKVGTTSSSTSMASSETRPSLLFLKPAVGEVFQQRGGAGGVGRGLCVCVCVRPVQWWKPRCYCLHQCIVAGFTVTPFTWQRRNYDFVVAAALSVVCTHTHPHTHEAESVLSPVAGIRPGKHAQIYTEHLKKHLSYVHLC